MHITDFNIAAMVKEEKEATSIAGTKPYMGKCGCIYIAPALTSGESILQLFTEEPLLRAGWSWCQSFWKVKLKLKMGLRENSLFLFPIIDHPLIIISVL